MDVYGLTGGIGSGKSTVAELLEAYGIPVVSADELSRIVVAKGSEGLKGVVELFGDGVLDERGELDRRKMAAIVFQDPSKRRQLEAILHPRIRERFEQVLDALEKAGHEVAVYEVPLLFEKNLQGEMKAVILVTADDEVRIRRVRERDDVTESEVRARITTQMDEATKRKRADYVIENNGSMDDLRREVEFLLARFLRVGAVASSEPETSPEQVPVKTGQTLPPLEAAPGRVRTQIPVHAPWADSGPMAVPVPRASDNERTPEPPADAPSRQRTEIPARSGQTVISPGPSPRSRTLPAGPPAGPAAPHPIASTTPNVPPPPTPPNESGKAAEAPSSAPRQNAPTPDTGPPPLQPATTAPSAVPRPAARQNSPVPPPVPQQVPRQNSPTPSAPPPRVPSKPAPPPAVPPPTPVPRPPSAPSVTPPASSASDASQPTTPRKGPRHQPRTQTVRAPTTPVQPSGRGDEDADPGEDDEHA